MLTVLKGPMSDPRTGDSDMSGPEVRRENNAGGSDTQPCKSRRTHSFEQILRADNIPSRSASNTEKKARADCTNADQGCSEKKETRTDQTQPDTSRSEDSQVIETRPETTGEPSEMEPGAMKDAALPRMSEREAPDGSRGRDAPRPETRDDRPSITPLRAPRSGAQPDEPSRPGAADASTSPEQGSGVSEYRGAGSGARDRTDPVLPARATESSDHLPNVQQSIIVGSAGPAQANPQDGVPGLATPQLHETVRQPGNGDGSAIVAKDDPETTPRVPMPDMGSGLPDAPGMKAMPGKDRLTEAMQSGRFREPHAPALARALPEAQPHPHDEGHQATLRSPDAHSVAAEPRAWNTDAGSSLPPGTLLAQRSPNIPIAVSEGHGMPDPALLTESRSSLDGVTRTLPEAGGQRQDLPRHLVMQITDVINRGGERPVDLTLNPAELGRVRISLLVTDGTVSVQLLADRPETLDLLRRSIDLLSQDFHEIGYEDAQFSFGRSGSDDAPAGMADPEQANDDGNEGDGTLNGPSRSVHVIATDHVDIRL